MGIAVAAHSSHAVAVPRLAHRPETPEEGLQFLAEWFEAVYPDAPDRAVETDLRTWAARFEADKTLLDAVKAWRDEYLIPKYGNTDWKCPFVKAIMEALHAAENA